MQLLLKDEQVDIEDVLEVVLPIEVEAVHHVEDHIEADHE